MQAHIDADHRSARPQRPLLTGRCRLHRLAACALATLLGGGCGTSRAPDGSAAPMAQSEVKVAGTALMLELPRLRPEVHSYTISSHAQDGSNLDFGNVIRTDAQGRQVLMEAAGPGAITRIQMSPVNVTGNVGDPASIGQIQVFFDGETTPRIDLAAADYFAGKTPPFLAPLCNNYLASSGGNYCELRMPFSKSVKVTVPGKLQYYDIDYETYPQGATVETFDPKSAATQAAIGDLVALLNTAGSPPTFLPGGDETAGTVTLAAGAASIIDEIPHAGTLSAIEVGLDPHDDASLRTVWLEVRWDGEAQPSVAAPLSDLFLSGAGERSAAIGLLGGYRPAQHAGYLYFPMPFSRSAEITLVNRSAAPVTASWKIAESAFRYDGIGTAVGRFHASYAEDAATSLGRDYVLLDTANSGKVAGFSYTERGAINSSAALFMEGDERLYFDGSRTPFQYGSGTEDFFNGGFYYAKGTFTLPDHGASDKEDLPLSAGTLLMDGRTSQYRLLLTAQWPFRNGLRFGIEHGAGDGQTTANHSVVFWYGGDQPTLRATDAIVVGDAASEQAAGYASGARLATSETGFFEGDADGDISSLIQDLANIGSLPPPPGTDPMGESVTTSGRIHPVGDVIRFSLRIDPANQGAILRRQLDATVFGQRAEVMVDGAPAGLWFNPGSNSWKRWAESDFAIPAALTAGKSKVDIQLTVLAPEEPPSGASTGWTDFGYVALSQLTAP